MGRLKGTLRQKNGRYYYRLTVSAGKRAEFALKTSDKSEAIEMASRLDAQREAPTLEVAMAQINAMKGFAKKIQNIGFADAWEKYEHHSDRATPATRHEELSYASTYNEFVSFVSQKPNVAADGDRRRRTNAASNAKGKPGLSGIAEVTPKVAEAYADFLRTTEISVSTHNRKILRLRKVFSCLKDYYDGPNPFEGKILMRRAREEHGNTVRRLAFTREQEEKLKEVLEDKTHVVKNKSEIRVAFFIGMYTAQRLKDCVLLRWQDVDFKHNLIWVKQFKTGKDVTIPISPELKVVLQDAAKHQVNQYVNPNLAERYLRTDANGKNTGGGLVDGDVLRVIRWIGVQPSVEIPGRKKKMVVYGFHSLRHSFVSFCAEAGVPKATVLSILGTDGEIADKYYTHVSDESQRKAIEAVSGVINGKSAQARIDSVIQLLDEKPAATEGLLERIRMLLCD